MLRACCPSSVRSFVRLSVNYMHLHFHLSFRINGPISTKQTWKEILSTKHPWVKGNIVCFYEIVSRKYGIMKREINFLLDTYRPSCLWDNKYLLSNERCKQIFLKFCYRNQDYWCSIELFLSWYAQKTRNA